MQQKIQLTSSRAPARRVNQALVFLWLASAYQKQHSLQMFVHWKHVLPNIICTGKYFYQIKINYYQ